jgi:hypothetical protein
VRAEEIPRTGRTHPHPIGALGDQYEEAIKLMQQYSGIKLKQATE